MNLRCVAVYDWSSDINSLSLFEASISWLDAIGFEIGFGIFMRNRTAKGIRLSENDLLRLMGDEKDFYSIEIFSKKNVDPADPAKDWRRYFSISGNGEKKKTLTINVPSDLTDSDGVYKLIAEFSNFGDLCYGVSFPWVLESNPALFISGITHGFPSTPEEKKRADLDAVWFSERLSMAGNEPRMRHRLGFFRDVYEFNVLNRNHISSNVNGVRLIDRIKQSADFGGIDAVSKFNWVWRILPKDITHVRDVLGESGLLIK